MNFDLNNDGKVDFKDFLQLLIPVFKSMVDNSGKINKSDIVKSTIEVVGMIKND